VEVLLVPLLGETVFCVLELVVLLMVLSDETLLEVFAGLFISEALVEDAARAS
jgi:hypothetical protein